MRWIGLAVVATLLVACGQDDYFHAPNPGNLSKDPYDFSAEKFPRDLQFQDDALMMLDDGGSDDMPSGLDLEGRDLKTTIDRDMTNH